MLTATCVCMNCSVVFVWTGLELMMCVLFTDPTCWHQTVEEKWRCQLLYSLTQYSQQGAETQILLLTSACFWFFRVISGQNLVPWTRRWFTVSLLFLTQAETQFEDLIANLKISKGNQQTPPPPAPPQGGDSQPDGPLSPQSFAMVNMRWSQNKRNLWVLEEPLSINDRVWFVAIEGNPGAEGDA